jgi:hypothetical protein
VGWAKGASVIGKVVHDEKLQQGVPPLIGTKGGTWMSEEGEDELVKAGHYEIICSVTSEQEYQAFELGLRGFVQFHREERDWAVSVADEEDCEERRNVSIFQDCVLLLWPAKWVVFKVLAG